MKKMIAAERAPKAIGPYSQAVIAHGMLYVSGQVPINPEAGKITEQGIEGQTRQVLSNIEAILTEAGLDWEDVVKTEVFLQDLEHFQVMNSLYGEKFQGEYKPARQAIQVARLPLDVLIEISCIATCH